MKHLTSLILLFVTCLTALADTINLAWDPNTESDLAGYKIYTAVGIANPTNGGSFVLTATIPAPATTYNFTNAQPGVTYTFYATAFNTANQESVPSVPVTYTPPVLALPFITSQPISVEVKLGNPFAFSIAATGTPPLIYQWFKDGTQIAGATNAAITGVASNTNYTGLYTCRVSNAGGSIFSENARLTVRTTPGQVKNVRRSP